jgi:hypothetical protein
MISSCRPTPRRRMLVRDDIRDYPQSITPALADLLD